MSADTLTIVGRYASTNEISDHGGRGFPDPLPIAQAKSASKSPRKRAPASTPENIAPSAKRADTPKETAKRAIPSDGFINGKPIPVPRLSTTSPTIGPAAPATLRPPPVGRLLDPGS